MRVAVHRGDRASEQWTSLETGPEMMRRGGGRAVHRGDIAAEQWTLVKEGIATAKELCAKGGDWERKNRLKVLFLSIPMCRTS